MRDEHEQGLSIGPIRAHQRKGCEHGTMSPGRQTVDPVVAIRRARPFDAPDLARIHVKSWSEAYAGLVPDRLIAAQTIETRTTRWRQTIGSEAMTPRIATVDGRPAGLMSIGPRGTEPPDDGTVGEVHTLYVVAAAWGMDARRRSPLLRRRRPRRGPRRPSRT